MKIGPIIILPASHLPFYREVKRIVSAKPEYRQGVKDGTVSLRFLPGYSPFRKQVKTRR